MPPASPSAAARVAQAADVIAKRNAKQAEAASGPAKARAAKAAKDAAKHPVVGGGGGGGSKPKLKAATKMKVVSSPATRAQKPDAMAKKKKQPKAKKPKKQPKAKKPKAAAKPETATKVPAATRAKTKAAGAAMKKDLAKTASQFHPMMG
jgi:hypothetical protein